MTTERQLTDTSVSALFNTNLLLSTQCQTGEHPVSPQTKMCQTPKLANCSIFFCWLHIFHPRHICSLAPRTSSSVPVILIDSPPNLIGLTWELISSPLPLSVFHQTTDAVARRGTHTREFSAWPSARSCSSLSLSALILHPTTPTSRCYLGWQNTQGLSLLLLLCSDIPVWSISVPASLCFQQSATDVSLFAKQMRAFSDVDSAEELNLNNASTLYLFFLLHQIMFPTSIALSRKGAVTRQWMCDDEFSNLLPLFSLIESHYSDEMLFLHTKAIK